MILDDNLNVKGRIEQFHLANGGDEKCVYVGSWFLYESGASREKNPWGALVDPPAHPYLLAKEKRKYWECKLRRAREMFILLKSNLLNEAKAGNTIRDEEITNLKKLRADCQSFDKQYEKYSNEEEQARPRSPYEAPAVNYEELARVQKIII